MSADVTNAGNTAEAGMALLDAAIIADSITDEDPRIKVLSEAGLFESMPLGAAQFLERAAIRAAIHRPILAGVQAGSAIITELVMTAAALNESPGEGHQP